MFPDSYRGHEDKGVVKLLGTTNWQNTHTVQLARCAEAVVILDAVGLIIAINEIALRLFGQSATALQGRPFRALRAHGAINLCPAPTATAFVYQAQLLGPAGNPFTAEVCFETVIEADHVLVIGLVRPQTGDGRVQKPAIINSSAIRIALATGRIRAAYQPIVALANAHVVGEEALARLVSDDGTVATAATFIDTAARTGILPQVDLAILTETLARCHARQVGAATPQLYFVNASATLLTQPASLADLQKRITSCSGPDPGLSSLVIEITERELIHDLASVRAHMEPLIAQGVRLALDDFGSGFSSFLYLAELPIAFLKIEQQLIGRITQSARVATMVRTICTLAHDLGITTIAEGIEDKITAQTAMSLGVDWGQGYYFGRPRRARGLRDPKQ